MRAYLETFFRAPAAFLIPVVAIPALALGGGLLMPNKYTVSATLWVEDSAVKLSASRPSETPSSREAQAFRERLATDLFLQKVIEEAELSEAVESLTWPEATSGRFGLGNLPLPDPLDTLLDSTAPQDTAEARLLARKTVYSSLSIIARGRNLLQVTYTGDDGEIGARLVTAALSVHLADNRARAQQQSLPIVQHYEEELLRQEAKMNEARVDLLEYKATLSSRIRDIEELQLADKQSFYEASIVDYRETRASLEAARVEMLREITRESNDLSIIDPAIAPGGPGLNSARIVMLVVVGFVLGVGLAATLVVLRNLTDRTIRSAEDVLTLLGAPILAVIPLTKSRYR